MRNNLIKINFYIRIAEKFAQTIAQNKKTSYLCIVFERMLFIISFH